MRHIGYYSMNIIQFTSAYSRPVVHEGMLKYSTGTLAVWVVCYLSNFRVSWPLSQLIRTDDGELT